MPLRQPVLEYKEWRNFSSVVDKAKTACQNSEIEPTEHFVDVNKSYEMPNGGVRQIEDVAMTRYACYLLVQNADPSKEVVAKAQTYFAIQTRRQELADQFPQLTEDERRIAIRNELKVHNIQLADAARDAGIFEPVDYAIFQNEGYKGLYGGLDAKDIHKRKNLKKSHKILDYMGSTELAANLFRATQTEDKLRKDNIQTKEEANKTHYAVGKKVRQTIEEIGGTMPEDLPTPTKSVKQLEREQQKNLKDKNK